jgi:orotate phosphoribosyltransferase
VIVDDVITDGGAKREAIELVRAEGATPVAVLIAFDRKERGRGARSAVQELADEFDIPVLAIATLDDLRIFIDRQPVLAGRAAPLADYHAQFGVQ